MIDKASSLEDILAHVWGMLGRGSADKRHPYRYPALATYGSKGIQQRIVVLREIDRSSRTLISYSDLRTQKLADISFHPETSWLFYDHGTKEQIRATSTMYIHHQDERALKVWEQIPPKGRADYIGPLPPGTSSQQYVANLPDDFMAEPTQENTAQGVNNFCLLKAEVKSIDFLKLMKDGHVRASFLWQQNTWAMQWVAP